MKEAAAITKASKSNLALAFMVLPPCVRADISTFYAFCRIVDDIADGGASLEEKALLLQQWHCAVDGPAENEFSLAHSVRELMDRKSLHRAHFHEIIQGVEMDLHGTRYASWEDLRVYCYRVAGVVGILSAQIFGAREEESMDYAVHLGIALQITNIIRDVGTDAANGGRVYLPLDELARFGITVDALIARSPESGFLDLMQFQALRALEFYAKAQSKLPNSDRRALAAAEIMRRIYMRLLKKMQRDGFRVMERRYRLSSFTKLYCVLSGWLASKQASSSKEK